MASMRRVQAVWRSTTAVLALGAWAGTVSASCLERSAVTSDCSDVCVDTIVCVRYSANASAQIDQTNETNGISADASGCAFRCLASTVDTELQVLTVHVPSGKPTIEDIAALTLPANITGLDLWVDTTAIQTFGFPGSNVVANGTLLSFLGLHGVSPETLPPPVFDLPLATLFLQLNSSEFQPVIVEFKTINTLVLDGGALSAFPFAEVIGDMPQVRVLSLTDNAITQIPVDDTTEPLYAASALRKLSLGQNKLNEFGAVFSSLHILDLRNNQLTRLPTSLEAMPALEEMWLDGNPIDATQFAPQLDTMQPLPGLEFLSLAACGLATGLPTKFEKVFSNLTYLDLAHNSLEAITAEDLPAESLVVLNVSSNKLSSIPSSFQMLQILDVSQNQLQSLPHTLPESLRILNASSNALMEVNLSGLANLDILDLSLNNLVVFPASLVWNASKLTVLRLSGNLNMTPLNLTQDQFKRLESLSQLTVDDGAFGSKACPSDWLVNSKHGITMCITRASGGELTKNPNETTTTVSPSPKNSRVAGVVTTIVLAIGGIIFGIAAYVHSQKRQRNLQQQQRALDHIHSGFDSASAMPFGEAPSTSKHATLFETSNRSKASSSSSSASGVNIWNDDKLLHLRVDMDSIRFFKVVGMGAYGQVWRGTCRISSTESRHVAIKTLTPDLARDRHVVRKFIAQTKLQATLNHPRVVLLVGVAWNSPTDLCVLMEFMPRGDLFATLHYSSSSSCSSTSTLFQTGVWSESKLQIALDMIDALSFAHAQSPIVLHRDLKSRNVLLDAHGRAKLSDFGVVVSSRDAVSVASPLWTAPEVLSGAGGYDEKTDVYSFGVILSELDTHEVPFGYDGYATTMLTSASKMKSKHAEVDGAQQSHLLQQIAAGEIHPKFSPSCPNAIFDIAQKCLSYDPRLRPSAVEVNFMLRRVEREGSDARMSSKG